MLERLRILATSEGLSSSSNDTWLIDGWRVGVAPDGEPRYLRFKDGKLGELATIDDVAAFVESRSADDDDPFAGGPASSQKLERRCAQCGTTLAHDAMFCQECGTRQRAEPPIVSAPVTTRRTSGLAIASLVLGLIGGSLIAVILGIVALRQIKRSQGAQEGRGMAIAGSSLVRSARSCSR